MHSGRVGDECEHPGTFVVFWTMRRLRLSEVLASGLTVAFSAGYAFVTDVGPPVWRAVLMLAVY